MRFQGRTAAAGVAAATTLACSWLGGVANASGRPVLYAAPHGSGSACTAAKPCALRTAVRRAPAGAVVRARGGTYHVHGLVITKRLDLLAWGKATINATNNSPTPSTTSHPLPPQNRGIVLFGPGAAGSVVRGFTVTGAYAEGILAAETSQVRVVDNRVVHNDNGAFAKRPVDLECEAAGHIPGDCGEGIHLLTTSRSMIAGNTSAYNTGGILLTDELGPTAWNLVVGNRVYDNAYDCGVTLAGHNGSATNSHQRPQPRKGGVYSNSIVGNRITDNGLKGHGAGVVLAGGALFAGVYDNQVIDNTISGNGMPGVTIHKHAPGDLNDNSVIGNVLSDNNRTGDPDFSPADMATTDVVVASAASPVYGTVIADNRLMNVTNGIWLLNSTWKGWGNTFVHVTHRIVNL
jgi:parallel beta-helix repeat protein